MCRIGREQRINGIKKILKKEIKRQNKNIKNYDSKIIVKEFGGNWYISLKYNTLGNIPPIKEYGEIEKTGSIQISFAKNKLRYKPKLVEDTPYSYIEEDNDFVGDLIEEILLTLVSNKYLIDYKELVKKSKNKFNQELFERNIKDKLGIEFISYRIDTDDVINNPSSFKYKKPITLKKYMKLLKYLNEYFQILKIMGILPKEIKKGM